MPTGPGTDVTIPFANGYGLQLSGASNGRRRAQMNLVWIRVTGAVDGTWTLTRNCSPSTAKCAPRSPVCRRRC